MGKGSSKTPMEKGITHWYFNYLFFFIAFFLLGDVNQTGQEGEFNTLPMVLGMEHIWPFS